MRGGSRRLRAASAAVSVAVLTTLAAGCTVGPASNRAASMAPPPPTTEVTDPPGNDSDSPLPLPTDEPTSSTPPPPPELDPASPEGSAAVSSILADGIGGLGSPCCVAGLPGSDDLLVGDETTGTIYRVNAATGEATQVGAVTGMTGDGSEELRGLAAQPSPIEGEGVINVVVYVAGSSASRIGSYRYVLDPPLGQTPWGGAEATLVDGITATGGGAFTFDADGTLYASTGTDVLRISSSSTNPADHVYSTGHTDVVGLAQDPAGRLWVADAGTVGGDTPASVSMVSHSAADGTVATLNDLWVAEEPGTIPTGLAYDDGSRSLWMTSAETGIWRIPLDGEGGVVNDGPALLPHVDLTDASAVAPGPENNTLRVLTSDGRVLQLDVS